MDKSAILDARGRPLRDLRISVTDRCNFRCSYCMPAEIFDDNYPFLQHDELLTIDELVRITRLFTTFGVNKVRITGGEPLLRKNIDQFIEEIAHMNEVDDIALTTNGVLLEKLASTLKEAGLQRVNVSLDSLRDDVFGKMNGRKISTKPVLAGMDAAMRAGLEVKVNMVVKKGVNEEDIVPMATYFRKKGITLRFIEYMDVGNTNGWKLDEVIPSAHILNILHEKHPLIPVSPAHVGEVAKRYRYEGTDTEVGFITSVSNAFCSTCTRARISADGKLYTCLFATKGHDIKSVLRNEGDEDVIRLIESIWFGRNDRYSEIRLQETHNKEKVEMSRIGG